MSETFDDQLQKPRLVLVYPTYLQIAEVQPHSSWIFVCKFNESLVDLIFPYHTSIR